MPLFKPRSSEHIPLHLLPVRRAHVVPTPHPVHIHAHPSTHPSLCTPIHTPSTHPIDTAPQIQIVSLAFILCQFAALTWYMLSYVPYGTLPYYKTLPLYYFIIVEAEAARRDKPRVIGWVGYVWIDSSNMYNIVMCGVRVVWGPSFLGIPPHLTQRAARTHRPNVRQKNGQARAVKRGIDGWTGRAAGAYLRAATPSASRRPSFARFCEG